MKSRRRDRTTHEGDHDTRREARTAPASDAAARDKFGGVNLGACFFGWLVAIATAVLLSGLVGAIAAGAGGSLGLSRSDLEQEAGAVGLGAAVVLALVLFLAYYAGGYVAGRMSRFDGARQGLVVWLIGLVVGLVTALVGWLFGSEYDVLARVEMPSLPISTDNLTIGGLVTALAVLVLTLLAAMLGGKVGRRYHRRVDRLARP